MNDKLKRKKPKKTTFFLIVALLIGITYIIGNTYAEQSGYKIIFNRYEDNEVMKTCYTDNSGKLDEDCLSAISTVCSKWSSYSQKDNVSQNTDSYTIEELKNATFDDNKNLYCVSGSSQSGYNKGCYICNNDSNIMKWKFNSNADDDCSSGYTKDTSINEENCKSIVPDSCYICKSDSNIMKWDNNGDADNNCSSGYKEDKTINNSQCKTITPSYCYVCRNNSNIMKWGTDSSSDPNCSSGYTPVAKSETECVPVENPKTGNILIFFVWILGLTSLCYSIYYFKHRLIN